MNTFDWVITGVVGVVLVLGVLAWLVIAIVARGMSDAG